MDMKSQHVTPESFWRAQNEFYQGTLKQAWKDMKFRCLFSLIYAAIVRYLISMSLVVSSLVLMLMMPEQTVIGIKDIVTTNWAAIKFQILTAWMALSFVLFVLSWIFKPWQSPARRYTDEQMTLWGHYHQDTYKAMFTPAEQ